MTEHRCPVRSPWTRGFDECAGLPPRRKKSRAVSAPAAAPMTAPTVRG